MESTYKPRKRGIVGLAKVFISLAIVVIVLVGVVMPTLHLGVNQTNWTTGEIALFGVIGLVAIATIIFSLF